MGLLRFFLACTVMLCHFHILPLTLSPILVCCFFVISGFHMQLLLSDHSLKAKDFYLSRVFRIYPLYWLFLILNVLAVWGDLHLTMSARMLIMYVFSAVFLLGRDVLCLLQYHPISGDFLPLYAFTDLKAGYLAGCAIPIVVGWALAVELVFYLLSPLILRLKTPAMLALGAASLLLNIFFAILYSHHPGLSAFWMECLLPSNLYFFLLGAAAYRFYNAYRRNRKNAPPAILWEWVIASLFFTTLLQSRESFVTLHWIALYYALPLITALLLPALFQASHQNRYDRWIGGLSYPLYLSHTIIGAYMLKIGANNTYTAFLIIFAVSIASYQFIEQPINRFRHRYFAVR